MRTVPLALGSHGVGAPVTPSMAARRPRACVPIESNWPPAYTIPPLATSANTVLFARGSHGSSCPVLASNAASEVRGCDTKPVM